MKYLLIIGMCLFLLSSCFIASGGSTKENVKASAGIIVLFGRISSIFSRYFNLIFMLNK